MHWLEKWLIPPRCVITGLPTLERDLSLELVNDWPVPQAVCPQCCEPSALGEVCGACLTQPPAFDRTQVGFYFDKELVDLIHGLKYQNHIAYAQLLGELLAERVSLEGVEALVAVPLFAKRFRDRGYNQAELIAESVAKSLQLPLIKQATQRVKEAPSQTHLSAEQRRKNLKQAFAIHAEKLAGLSHIALIDDVVTTGATMQSLADEIKQQTDVQVVEAWAVAKTK
ncbi:MAG: ComF family protein [Thiotrichales bacterium]|nr:ComF family protein [Thiotrichales bacterium]